MWESLEADGEALLNSKWEQYRYKLQENAQDPVAAHPEVLWSGGAGLENDHCACRTL